jgi:hypothetical protein
MAKNNNKTKEEPLENQLWNAEFEAQLQEVARLNVLISENLGKVKLDG